MMGNLNILLILFTFGIFFVSTEQRLITLEDRVNALETQVLIESLKNRQAVERLEQLVKTMNSPDRKVLGDGVSSDVQASLNEVTRSLNTFMEQVTDKVNALAKGLAEEKVVARSNTNSNRNELQRQDANIKSLKEKIKVIEQQSAQTAAKANSPDPHFLEMVLERLNKTSVAFESDFSSEKQRTCPEGWFRIKKTCYLYVPHPITDWLSAINECHKLGGKLTEPKNAKTMNALVKAVGKTVWVGATDDAEEGTWVWISSHTKIDIIKWSAGQPNSFGGKQNCLELHSVGAYNDESCMAGNRYVCEKTLAI